MRWMLASLFLLSANLFSFQTESHVKANLLANRESIQKGESFLLAIHLKMSEHWHTYWENPGFSGLPTTWNLNKVPGLSVGKLRFSLPQKFVDDAGFITYGYENEALLTAPATYSGEASEITISGLVKWLECRELCLPGQEKVKLTLKVGESKPAHGELFDKYLKLTPKPHDADAPFTYTTRYQFEKETWRGTLTLTPKEGQAWSRETGDFAFFPLSNDASELKEYSLRVEDGRYLFDLHYDAYEEEPPPDLKLGGVVRLQIGEEVRVSRLALYPSSGSAQTRGAGPAGSRGAPVDPTTGFQGVRYTLLTILLFAFIGGLILNLMPCVLPVLSLKIFSLLKEAGEQSGRRIRFGWVYTLGILVSFLVLSLFFVGAKAAGEELGIGFQFQSPGFVIAISALIFAMGLSFFGVYHIGAPNSDKLHNLSQKSGYAGAFYQGALMTILSTPCTAPFLGAAYGWALSQPAAVIILVFQVVAFGLAFPYLLLCYAPALLKFFPKPGPWMNHFKIAMGFLMMATLVWLFNVLADLTGSAGVVGLLILLLGLAAAAWIYGQTFHSEGRAKGLALIVVVSLAGVYLGLFKFFDIREPFKEKRAQEENLRLAILSQGGGGDAQDVFAMLEKKVTTPEEIAWIPYSPSSLDYFRGKNRLVFLDFTASWCITCQANEKLVLDTAKVRKLFADRKVVTMKADYTDRDDHLTEMIRGFQRAGVPLYVVYPGQEPPILLPETITKSIVASAIENARVQLEQRSSLLSAD